MAKKDYSRPGLFGSMNNYDNREIFGDWSHYDR